MAITNDAKSPAELYPAGCVRAALAAIVVAVALATVLVASLVRAAVLPAELWAVGVMGLGVLAASLVMGLSLLRGQAWALWSLLAIWLVVATVLLLLTFQVLLWGEPIGWDLGAFAWLLPGLVVLTGGLSGLLVAATAKGSRSRYGSMVAASVAAVVAVVFVANMTASALELPSIDLEAYGQFGMSDRTRRVLDKVDQPVRISVVYTATKAEADTASQREKRAELRQRLTRIMELLQQVNEYNRRVEVVDASSDAARAALLERMRARQRQRTGVHEEMLDQIIQAVPALQQEMERVRVAWSTLPKDAWLNQWNFGPQIDDAIGQTSHGLDLLARQIRQELTTTALPDSPALLTRVGGGLADLGQTLIGLGTVLEVMETVPQQIASSRQVTMAAVKLVAEGLNQAAELAGKPSDPMPDDATAVMHDVAVQLGQVSNRGRNAVKLLSTVAGTDMEARQILLLNPNWQTRLTSGEVLGWDEYLEALVRRLDQIRATLAVRLQEAQDDETVRKTLGEVRPILLAQAAAFTQVVQQIDTVLATLADVDDASGALLQNNPFGALQTRLESLNAAIAAVPEPTGQPLPTLDGENLIVLESDSQVEVLTYDDVWPARANDQMPASDPKRFFHGDAAISSALLAMTHSEPFGRVLITYCDPTANAPKNPYLSGSSNPIPYDQLETIRRQLADANFLVQDWNLIDPMPEFFVTDDTDATTRPATTRPASLPTVLLVLPPAEPTAMGALTYGPEQESRLTQAIDAGASAVFLARFAKGGNYAYKTYLQEQWGVDAKTGSWVVYAVPGEGTDRFRIDPIKLTYLPLNTFSEHAVAKPLRGRDVRWTSVCPIQPAESLPTGVQVESLLTIPATMTNVWASADFSSLVKQVYANDGWIQPRYEAGDVASPFSVAVVATREASGDRPAGRILVLGMGLSFIDEFLISPIATYDPDEGYRPEPAPTVDAELLVNAAWWLAGREGYIAPGPAAVTPVRAMSTAEQSLLWVLGVIGLPAAVLVLGGVVLAIRRRS